MYMTMRNNPAQLLFLVHYRHPSLFGFAAIFFHLADELGH